ncbi:hypothetical protein TetV_471 [Tetraselmis virus 1]|uniref:Uncharacterized protein n=1 Tax=Tetraselmis virus 1 TaxID=2060617 RepID=A0A2P0VNS8_9VIRU|nr:hypothetical protein QJ968_gp583 [Tetraselmis virus 1]AUF82553.1 hypothetical protein TetV_471 [Tetraselmis virus 1]
MGIPYMTEVVEEQYTSPDDELDLRVKIAEDMIDCVESLCVNIEDDRELISFLFTLQGITKFPEKIKYITSTLTDMIHYLENGE